MSDAQARFTELFEDCYPRLCAYVSRRAPADRRDDLVADVFLTAWRHLDQVPSNPLGDRVTSVDRVRAAFRGLPARDCEAIQLVCWEQLSVAEASVVLNCSPSALSVRLHRARRRLAADLELLDSADDGARLGTELSKEQTS